VPGPNLNVRQWKGVPRSPAAMPPAALLQLLFTQVSQFSLGAGLG
jgi:hypothetical protein